MRLVIDLQAVQEPVVSQDKKKRFLGIAAMLGRAGAKLHDVIVVVNGASAGLPQVQEVRARLEKIIPQENIRLWYPPDGMGTAKSGKAGLRRFAEYLYEGFIASLGPDVLILPELSLGWNSSAVNSVGLLGGNFHTLVVLPLGTDLAAKQADPQKELWRQGQLAHLKRADAWINVQPADGYHTANALLLPPEKVLDCPELGLDTDDSGVQGREVFRRLSAFLAGNSLPVISNNNFHDRRRLAYVSPLPPQQTGISYYSAELLPELARYYHIDVVTTQDEVDDAWVRANCGIRSVEWFLANAGIYDRVLYQFGNSSFHAHMWALLEQVPGIAVIHDFYLGDAQAYRNDHGIEPRALAWNAYTAHGYPELKKLLTSDDRVEALRRYPFNHDVIQRATGVIVHSEHARQLAVKWYGDAFPGGWRVVPHLRIPPVPVDKAAARSRLDIPEGDFVVCSFGVVAPPKLNHRLLEAWLNSYLDGNSRARLIFVGGTPDAYGVELQQRIKQSATGHIAVTGWADENTFKDYLNAADVAVQLRRDSRGETSGTLLDAMAHGVATICNAHGSFVEIPDDGVWKLADDFDNASLQKALEVLHADVETRAALGKRGSRVIREHYAPWDCAQLYREAIEQFYQQRNEARRVLAAKAVELMSDDLEEAAIAAAIGAAVPERPRRRQLLIDVSVVAREDLRTGVQRVVRSILSQLIENPPIGYRIEPVYTTVGMSGYFYARAFAQRFMGIEPPALPDEPVEAFPGDLFLGLDLCADGVVAHQAYFDKLYAAGVRVYFVIHDLLPVTHPHWFPEQEEAMFDRWLATITRYDGAICVSCATANALHQWMTDRQVERLRPYRIGVAHNGADIRQSIPTVGLSDDATAVLEQLGRRPSFLMVGTVEARKGHSQVLDAFEHLWSAGVDCNLVIVGKKGWHVEILTQRMEEHSEQRRRLYWLPGVSDQYLEAVYDAASCLIAASEGEGFGLPLIEAAQHEVPILARDIPVFREVAGDHADYFAADTPGQLAAAVQLWLKSWQRGEQVSSCDMPYLTWSQSAGRYVRLILYGEWDFEWPNGDCRKLSSSARVWPWVGALEQ